MRIVCEFCGGIGHPKEKCSSNTLLKLATRAADCSWQFGAYKNALFPQEEVIR